MVWVRFSTFFSNLKMKNEKWTFIFVLFSKIQNRFEKTLHHSFLSVRLRHFRDLTFMLWYFIFSYKRLWALCCGLHIREWGCKRSRKSWGGCFHGFLFGHFRGMFWNSISAARRNRYSGDFGEMEQHSSPQKDCAKVGEAILPDSWLAIFGGYFEYWVNHRKTLFCIRI